MCPLDVHYTLKRPSAMDHLRAVDHAKQEESAGHAPLIADVT